MRQPSPRIGALLDPSILESAQEGEGGLQTIGLESFSLSFWESLGGRDVEALAGEMFARFGLRPSCLSVYGNPLAEGEGGARFRSDLERLMECAPRLGCRLVSTFAGRVPGASVPDSMERFRGIFAPLCERAAALGVSIAFENCRFGDTWKSGKWNIAMNPDAWELIFAALPGAPIGLEWEPAHQILALADPLVQLGEWLPRILHIHAKDARVDRDLLASRGMVGPRKIGEERLAGEGEADWKKIMTMLIEAEWRGSVDVEIGATPGWGGDRSFEGISRAIANLRRARAAAGEARLPG